MTTTSTVEYITTETITHSSPLSFHKLSRECKIPISKAKKLLYEYYQKNKEKITASFITTGISNSNMKLIKYSENEGILVEDLKKFTEIFTIHIFCIMKSDLNLSTNDIALNELKIKSSLNKINEYEELGIIKGSEISDVFVENKNIASPTKPKTPQPKKEEKKPIKSAGLTSSYVSRKDQAKQKQPLKRSAPEPETKPSYQYKSRKTESKKPKERVVVNYDPMDVDTEDDEVKQVPAPTTDLNNMFGEDETFEFSDEEVKEQKVEESIPEAEPEQKAEPVEDEEEQQLFVEEEEDPKEEEPEMIQEVDEDGYTVTRRKARPVTKPQRNKFKPKAINKMAPPKEPKKSNDSASNKKKTQSSLMSFFGKM
ncbi:hypothetical protein KGF54_002788 [Candida jiufengensis]|uniref:uncharacterized protein n=1 Tax=Candida jiufengensis TaxID=497108 RepID=UPI00222468A5|nr:uncharacterized protein KGF54_002788 [Candida jiufengensis]KAI5953416.1 hypothetical protein KGF54_002788 [Candida jiufengensis]